MENTQLVDPRWVYRGLGDRKHVPLVEMPGAKLREADRVFSTEKI